MSIPLDQESKNDTEISEFTLFPKLPLELRRKIWRSTLSGPRNVGIKIRLRDKEFDGWMARNDTIPPVALQVCHESREEASRYYTLSFGTAAHPPMTYFNYEIDTLHFDHGRTIHKLVGRKTKAMSVENITKIALDVEWVKTPPWKDIRRFVGLEELVVYEISLGQDDREHGHLMAWFKTTLDKVVEAYPRWVVPKIKVVFGSGKESILQPGPDASV